jgi:RND family efflux transporter MFP subunit
VNAAVTSEIDGIVRKIHAPLGQKVTPRQRLLTLGHTDPAFQYAPLSVFSPVSGIVSQVDVTEGSRIIKGQKLLTVTDPALVKVSVEIPALDLVSFSTAKEGELKIPGRAEPVPVTVKGISPFVDPASGTATAELEPKTILPPGVVGLVTFKTNLHKGISVPEQALIYQGKETLIKVVENGTAHSVPVSIGKRQKGEVEVIKGLSSGMQIIERSSSFVAEGEKVTVQSAPAKTGGTAM